MGKKETVIKADTWAFTDENNKILPKKLGDYIKNSHN